MLEGFQEYYVPKLKAQAHTKAIASSIQIIETSMASIQEQFTSVEKHLKKHKGIKVIEGFFKTRAQMIDQGTRYDKYIVSLHVFIDSEVKALIKTVDTAWKEFSRMGGGSYTYAVFYA